MAAFMATSFIAVPKQAVIQQERLPDFRLLARGNLDIMCWHNSSVYFDRDLR
jgi:hypothetical protein